jgi:hypothetical protein
MSEHIFKLSTEQLHEVYSALWREFVTLHKQATINPNGLAKAVIERVRQSRTTTAQVCDMIEAMRPDLVTTDESYLSARAHAQIEADHGVIFAATRNGASFVMPEFPNAGKPYDLSKIAPFAFPMPLSFESRPSNEVLEAAELGIGLHGKDFAMLTEDELKRFQLLRKIGRKFGLRVSVEVLDDSDDIQAEIAAASPSQQEEIYRRLRTQIDVRWFAIDKQG